MGAPTETASGKAPGDAPAIAAPARPRAPGVATMTGRRYRVSPASRWARRDTSSSTSAAAVQSGAAAMSSRVVSTSTSRTCPGTALGECRALGHAAGAMQEEDDPRRIRAGNLDGRRTEMRQVELHFPGPEPRVGRAAEVVAEADAGREQQDEPRAEASRDFPNARRPTGRRHVRRVHQQFRIQNSECSAGPGIAIKVFNTPGHQPHATPVRPRVCSPHKSNVHLALVSQKWDIGTVRRVPASGERPLHWVGSSKRDLMGFPKPVQEDVGNALGIAQFGNA